MPSPQIQQLMNIIALAQHGDPGAEELLREIMIHAVEAAPFRDLCTLGECLVSIGNELRSVESGRN